MTCAATIATTSIKVLLACRRSWPRNNIPANVPFDQIASNGAYANRGYSGGNYSNRAYSSNGQSRLSVDDQREFDKYYSKWLEDMRKNLNRMIVHDLRNPLIAIKAFLELLDERNPDLDASSKKHLHSAHGASR